MWRLRLLGAMAGAIAAGPYRAAGQLPGSPLAEITPTTVVSLSDRRWAPTVGLKVIVRDVDQPDLPIAHGRAVLERPNAPGVPARYMTSDSAGVASMVLPESGDYHVTILSIGYDRLEFRIRLPAECQNVLEVYIARAVEIGEPPIYTGVKAPNRTRSRSRTLGRAVLTTCPPAA